MPSDPRLLSARLAYQRALVAARLAPTPRRWRKLVAAAKTLRVAQGRLERRRLAALPAAARKLAVEPLGDARRDAELVPFPPPGTPPAEARRAARAAWERAATPAPAV